MPEAFERTSEYLVKLLDPVIKPKNSEGGGEGGASTSQPSSSSNTNNNEGDQKSKKKKEKVKKQSQPPQEEADPFAKANLTTRGRRSCICAKS